MTAFLSSLLNSSLVPVIEKHETGLLMLLGFAGFSAMIGFLYNMLRFV